MGEPDGRTAGPQTAAGRLADLLLGLAKNRLRLFSLEVEAERLRLVNFALKLAVALAVAMTGLLLGTITLALYLWDTARYGGLILITLLLLGAGGFLLWRLRRALRVAPAPFRKTVAEFDKDRECLTTKD